MRVPIVSALVAAVLMLATGLTLTLAGDAKGGEPGVEQLIESVRGAEQKADVYRVKFVRMKRYARKVERDNGRKTRILLHDESVGEALDLACATYGNCSTLWRRARCESKLDPHAKNATSGAAGLLQFVWSTWRSTPFRSFSPSSPYANALAAGWMIGPAGRSSEWSCR